MLALISKRPNKGQGLNKKLQQVVMGYLYVLVVGTFLLPEQLHKIKVEKIF